MNSRFPLTNLLCFFLVLFLAWKFAWNTTDLIWSLWLSSLLIGYASILCTIAAGLFIVHRAARPYLQDEHFSKAKVYAAVLGALAIAAFLVTFFSFHFCGFHAGHAGFLSHFFPLEHLEPEAFFDGFMNPLLLLKTALTEVAPLYFWFLIPALIFEAQKVIAPLKAAFALKLDLPLEQTARHVADNQSQLRGDFFFAPYINVIRLHILIFFFAGCFALKIDHFLIYAVVYAVYFFPWSIFRKPKE